MKKIIPVVIIVVVLLVVFLMRKTEEPVRFETAEVIVKDLSTTILSTGTIRPVEQVEVGTQVSGTIESILVDFNDVVEAGQTLAILDRATLLQQVQLSEASYNGILSERDYLQTLLSRDQQLFDQDMITEEALNETQYRLEQAESHLERARIDKSRARTNLNYATIKSPIDGVVLDRAVEKGQTVAASLSTPTLFTIARDLTDMELLASVDEADIASVEVGFPVEFTVDSWPDTSFVGTVSSIHLLPIEEANVITYSVVISTENPDRKLFPGMTATVEIELERAENAITIPAKALRFTPPRESLPNHPDGETPPRGRPAGSVVWMLENDQFRSVSVQTGINDGISVEIIDGLSDGDAVVVGVERGGSEDAGGGQRNPFMQTRGHGRR